MLTFYFLTFFTTINQIKLSLHKRLAPLKDSNRPHLEHNGINLFFDFLVGYDHSALRALQKQVKESQTLLLANIGIIYVQVVLETSRLAEGETFNWGGAVGRCFGFFSLGFNEWWDLSVLEFFLLPLDDLWEEVLLVIRLLLVSINKLWSK